MSGFLHTIVSFIVALGILITVHEFGHFWVARRLGVKVLRFSIGFGRPLWRRRFGADQTEFVVAALPLGGYVRMLDESEGEVAPAEQHRAFNRQSLAVRVAVVIAGPLFNLLFAVLVYWAIFMAGDMGTRPLIGSVTEGSPAAQSGFRAGDLVIRIEGNATPTWETMVMTLIAEKIDQNILQVDVRTEDGIEVARHLPVAEIGGTSDAADFLGQIGIKPWRPIVPPVLGKLTPGGAAVAAGLQPGDLIISADGQAMDTWLVWVEYVRQRPEQEISVVIERDGVVLRQALVPERVTAEGQDIGRIGAYVDIPPGILEQGRVEIQYPPVTALWRALDKTADTSMLMLKMLGGMLLGQVSVDNLSGPISIAQYAGESAQVGWLPFLKFLAVVSISLGVLNLLPVPILDGGHLLFYAVEFIKGSPLSEAAQAIGQRIGLVMLLALMSVAFYQDIERLLSG